MPTRSASPRTNTIKRGTLRGHNGKTAAYVLRTEQIEMLRTIAWHKRTTASAILRDILDQVLPHRDIPIPTVTLRDGEELTRTEEEAAPQFTKEELERIFTLPEA